MQWMLRVETSGRILNPKSGRLVAMAYGATAITPRNLSQVLSRMQSEFAGNLASMSGKRQHSPLVITKEPDSASPQLLNAHWKQELLASVNFNILGRPDSGAGETVVPRVALTNATIASSNRYTPSLAGQPSSGSGEVVVSRITLTNAQISNITRISPLQLPKHRHSLPQINTNELEEISFVFQSIRFTSLTGSTSAADDWLATG